MQSIRVLIADDQGIVRAGIRSLLEPHEDIRVVGEAADGWQAVEEAIRLEPDVLLMDISMPRLRGIEATSEIHQRLPQVRILALTVHDREEYFFAMLKAGGSGYVLKEGEPEELIAAIRAVYRGEAYLSPLVTRSVLDDYLGRRGKEVTSAYDHLTLRQKEVLQLVVSGKTTREIAEILGLSVRTVEKHRSSMMKDLGLQNLPELMTYAMRKGLIDV
jgi:DNA-binding NarL/FixJ family response regulator